MGSSSRYTMYFFCPVSDDTMNMILAEMSYSYSGYATTCTIRTHDRYSSHSGKKRGSVQISELDGFVADLVILRVYRISLVLSKAWTEDRASYQCSSDRLVRIRTTDKWPHIHSAA